VTASPAASRWAILRIFGISLALAFLLAAPLLIWLGPDGIDLTPEMLIERLEESGWAWTVGIGLIVSDIAAPVLLVAAFALLPAMGWGVYRLARRSIGQ